MKLVMFGDPCEERPGVLIGKDHILDLERPDLDNPISLESLLSEGLLPAVADMVEDLAAQKKPSGLIRLADTRLGPPLSGIGKIICCGLNYRAHAEETGAALPTNPLLFAKAGSSIAGPYDDLVLPPPDWSAAVDYEVELGVVIGTPCWDVSVEDALAYVAGYLLVNDVTARDVQRAESQWFRAKSYDGFCPVGPWLVTADDIPCPDGLPLWTKVNGEVRQSSSTADLIFSVAEIISFVSRGMTLMPGDLIATGTPSGIGGGMKPPRYLTPGDLIEMGVGGLGQQRIPVVAHDAP